MYNSDKNFTAADKAKCKGFDDVIYPKSLAVAYVPIQKVCGLYSLCEALIYGTVFPELNKPFTVPFGSVKPKKTDCKNLAKGGCKNEC